MRCFIEIDVPEGIKGQLYEKAQQIKAACESIDCSMNITKTENIHVTLLFLGEVGEKKIDSLIRTLSEVSKNFASFECSISKAALVPEKEPHMIWVLINDNPFLKRLHFYVKNALAMRDKERDFAAHITITRLKMKSKGLKSKDALRIKDALSAASIEAAVKAPQSPRTCLARIKNTATAAMANSAASKVCAIRTSPTMAAVALEATIHKG